MDGQHLDLVWRAAAEARWLAALAAELLGWQPGVLVDRRAAGYVDRILRRGRPAELPIPQPSTFELVANTTALQALASRMPMAVLR
jgi:hypothetical protein